MKNSLFALLVLTVSTAFAGISDTDAISRDLEKKTIVFKNEVKVKAGPKYQSAKILWNAGDKKVRAWVYPETENGVTIPAGEEAVVSRVYVDKTSLLGANVKAKTKSGVGFSAIFQYDVSDRDALTGNVEIPTVGDLKLAFDLK